ncbi:hypothetical protein NF27_FW00170 [Candidatus Jidaibacter acanthamoeba]|uniref:Transposase Synechocystis PCC 6803 domain-containing protein n=1 Tax=Candidatus Jidaibacter acanthamoebae TaxID=86105 RepID=A0A0C1QL02_9RICK|nr:IS630 transposase-related protein [Candidatus Jidaibacter acanthamoeba]KIE04803.1 hypothetical protein NF27_FW00170 [Candidatus Jidaibacter acanthamoeba]
MSTSPYSLDLREKVIRYLEAGNRQREAAKVFNLNKTTVNKWHVRYKSKGHFCARKRPGAKPRIDIEKFIRYVEENLNARAEDIGKAFGMSSGGGIYWLKKLGFIYKKKPLPMWKLVKRGD